MSVSGAIRRAGAHGHSSAQGRRKPWHSARGTILLVIHPPPVWSKRRRDDGWSGPRFGLDRRKRPATMAVVAASGGGPHEVKALWPENTGGRPAAA